MSFGYKTAWFAVRASDPAAVMQALRLTDPVPSTAEVGIAAGYGVGAPGLMSTKAFVTGPLDGWILAMSTGFFHLCDVTAARISEVVARVSAETSAEAQFFATHRGSESHLWVRAIDGQLRRAYSYSDEKVMDVGEATPEERALGFAFFDPASPDASDDAYWGREDLRRPDEEDVMSLAERWSVNPSALAALPDGFVASVTEGPPPAVGVVEAPKAARKPWWQFW